MVLSIVFSNYLKPSTKNKGNGFRKAFAVGLGTQI